MPNTDLDTTRLLAKIAALEQLVEEYEQSVYAQANKLQEKEEALRLHATRMASIMDTSLDAIIVMDSQGVILDWNTQATNIFGWQKHDALGCTVAETIIPPQHREAHQRGLSRFLTTGDGPILNRRIDITALHQTGHEFPVELAITATKINEQWQFTAFIVDITERKQAERRLAAQHAVTQVLAESPTLEEASERILQVLCECLGWAVGSLWRVDSDANLLRCLETWQIPKTEADEFITISRQRTFAPGVGIPGRVWSNGKPAWIPNILKDPNFPRAPMAAKAGLHGAIGFPIKIGKNVYGVFEFFSREIREPDVYLLQMAGEIGIKVGQFIERKQMEAHASEIERLTTQGQLTDGIAHEMKNPLFVLTGRLQLMKEKLAQHDYGTLLDDLQKVESTTTRMVSIADRFSKLVKSPSSSPEPTAVQTVLTQVLELLADELTKNRIAVTTTLTPNLPKIRATPQQLQNAFTNLIVNAMQAMAAAHGKGTLTVTAALLDGRIEIRIQDDGPGIAPEHRARLFEPFFTTKPAGQGTGMGLWAARSTAMALRGTVACETDTGKGATFIMRLPVEKTEHQA